jgi:hypothetical protein
MAPDSLGIAVLAARPHLRRIRHRASAACPKYRVQLQNWINERGGYRVEFKTLRRRLRLYGPELVFDQAVVRTPDGTRVLATAKRGSVALRLWSSIRHAGLTAGRFLARIRPSRLIRTRKAASSCSAERAAGSRQAVRDSKSCRRVASTFAMPSVTFRDAITGAVRGRCPASTST